MTKLLCVLIGGGFGSLARYLLSGWAQRLSSGSFPLGTLTVNVAGCLLLGFLAAALGDKVLVREEIRIAVTVGLLGGFTTFSTFGLETFMLLNDGQPLRAAANVCLSVGLGLFAVWSGYRLAENWLGA